MKGLLKASGLGLALVAMTAVLLFAFAPLERGRGQTPALAPTPMPTPRPFTFTPTPTPRADAPKADRPVVDPTWNPPLAPTYPVLPTSTPLPATGGPYISEARAIEIALASVEGRGQMDLSISPKTLFTTAKEVQSILIEPSLRTQVVSDREFWVVWLHGRFKAPRSPAGDNPVVFSQARVIIDATTGEITTWGLLDGR